MAKKIDLGLDLKGQDAIDFQKYIDNPEYTERSREMLEKAYAMSVAGEKCDGRPRHKC